MLPGGSGISRHVCVQALRAGVSYVLHLLTYTSRRPVLGTSSLPYVGSLIPQGWDRLAGGSGRHTRFSSWRGKRVAVIR